MAAKYTIDLDCAPGTPRPDCYLPAVLRDTGVTIDPDKTISRFFGNWTWEVPQDQEELYAKVRDTIKARITALYNDGNIRYGSW